MGGYIREDEAQATSGTFSDGWRKGGKRQDDVAEWPRIRKGVRWREIQPWQHSVAGKNREKDGGWSLWEAQGGCESRTIRARSWPLRNMTYSRYTGWRYFGCRHCGKVLTGIVVCHDCCYLGSRKTAVNSSVGSRAETRTSAQTAKHWCTVKPCVCLLKNEFALIVSHSKFILPKILFLDIMAYRYNIRVYNNKLIFHNKLPHCEIFEYLRIFLRVCTVRV